MCALLVFVFVFVTTVFYLGISKMFSLFRSLRLLNIVLVMGMESTPFSRNKSKCTSYLNQFTVNEGKLMKKWELFSIRMKVLQLETFSLMKKKIPYYHFIDCDAREKT